jgi:hypothetical protein
MLTAPLAAEPVIWCSGVFDLSATTLILSCVVLGRQYDGNPTWSRRVSFIVIGLAALAAKETAAIAGLLVLVDAFARSKLNRKLLVDIGILIGLVGIVSLIRLVLAYGPTTPTITKYAVQRFLFESFGGLAVPWHLEVIRNMPWIAILAVLLYVVLLTRFFITRAASSDRAAIAAAFWIPISVLPVFSFLYVGPDLQGSRFLYLAAVGWSGLICVIASASHVWQDKVVCALAAGGLVLTGAVGVTHHVGPWIEAGSLRGRIQHALRSNESMRRCSLIALTGLPDNVRGAYVFRNGIAEAIAMASNQELTTNAQPMCAFEWRNEQQDFIVSRR